MSRRISRWVRCHAGYGRLMVTLDAQPMTRESLADVLHASPNVIGSLLRQMHGRGLRVGSWEKSNHGPMRAVWAVGSDPDAACEGYCRTPPYDQARPEAAAFMAVLHRLQSEPSTARELQECSGLSPGTVRKLLASIRPLIYVHSWDRNSHIPVQCWFWGKHRDADRPKRQPAVEVWRRCYWRRKERQNAALIAAAFALNEPQQEATA